MQSISSVSESHRAGGTFLEIKLHNASSKENCKQLPFQLALKEVSEATGRCFQQNRSCDSWMS
jgi:hypothetical protein